MRRPDSGGKKFFFRHRKKCRFCEEKMEYVDYKNVRMLDQYVTDRGKMISRRLSGTCARHQRKLEDAVKNARIMALLPFVKS
jgi:small subunit ribosomal protein S18